MNDTTLARHSGSLSMASIERLPATWSLSFSMQHPERRLATDFLQCRTAGQCDR
jgi:hypothetical protein